MRTDGRSTRLHPLGELLLGDAQLDPANDHAHHMLEGSQARPLVAVFGAVLRRRRLALAASVPVGLSALACRQLTSSGRSERADGSEQPRRSRRADRLALV